MLTTQGAWFRSLVREQDPTWPKKNMREREGAGRLWAAEGSPVYWPHLLYHVELSHFSHVQLFVTPWTVACQAPPSMGFSRQAYWSGLPFPTPGDLPNPGIETETPAMAGRFFTTEPPEQPIYEIRKLNFLNISLLQLADVKGNARSSQSMVW